MRALYALGGAIIGILVDLAVNLLAAVIQARTPAEQFARWPVGWLLGFILVGLAIGWWLGAMLTLEPRPAATTAARPAASEPIKIRRLRAFLSYADLRGQGIELSDILLVASWVKVDSR